MESFSPIRCAIYTRKSTDEGLEKEFNTLKPNAKPVKIILEA